MTKSRLTLYHIVFHDGSSQNIVKASMEDVVKVFSEEIIHSITVLEREYQCER